MVYTTRKTVNRRINKTVKFESCGARMDIGSRNKPINRALDTLASRSNCWKKHKNISRKRIMFTVSGLDRYAGRCIGRVSSDIAVDSRSRVGR